MRGALNGEFNRQSVRHRFNAEQTWVAGLIRSNPHHFKAASLSGTRKHIGERAVHVDHRDAAVFNQDVEQAELCR